MTVREPRVTPVALADLRPTQMTVGFREVAEKRRSWRERPDDKGAAFLGKHMIPVIAGPKGRHFVTDHHHLARALLEEGIKNVLINVVADLSKVDRESFWVVMDCRGWCHPYDSDGIRRTFADIPQAVSDLQDDPFRSLAGELRRTGGFAKDTTPFSEFIWADFLRRKIKRTAIEKDFNGALASALTLAKTKDAGYLPGWCGPVVRVR
ncbi:MAG: putative ParB-like nuclease [Rhodospirillales bacterium]|nr:putative ParB-like nuclease [Rhodospirillales bacterium]